MVRRWQLIVFLLLGIIAGTQGNPTRRTFLPRTQIATTTRDDHTKSILRSDAADVRVPNNIARGGGAVSLPPKDVMSGAVIFLALDHIFRQVFLANDITFPSPLGGCGILLFAMVLGEFLKPGLGDAVFQALNPGAMLLAKWIPVFFVPGLAMLPNAPSMGSPFEIMKVLAIVVVGFYFSAASTAYAVLGLRKMEGADTTADVSEAESGGSAPLPFSAELVSVLFKACVVSGSISIGASRFGHELETPLRAIFMTLATFFGYVWGARLPPAFTKIVHPLVTSTAVALGATQLISLTTSTSFTDVLDTYKQGTMNPLRTGAGDILLYLLGPSVVSFAISIYSRKKVIADNFLTVFTSMIIGSAGGLFSTAAFVRLLKLGGEAGSGLRRAMLPRNITTPLAIAISNIIGADVSQACAVVCLTGIYGATTGKKFMSSLGITDPVSRGLGIGASAQGLGVASMMDEKEAFPFAAVSMVLTAVAATVLVSIPPVTSVLLTVAGAH